MSNLETPDPDLDNPLRGPRGLPGLPGPRGPRGPAALAGSHAYPMTGDEADRNSIRRARKSSVRVVALALVVFFALLVFAWTLQVQTDTLRDQQAQLLAEVQANHASALQMCNQRRVNAIKSTAYYNGMIAIESRNKFIDDDIRQARLRLFRAARPNVPTC